MTDRHSSVFRGDQQVAFNSAVGRIVLGDEDFEGLSAFFGRIQKSSHAFKVAMARRCFNLYNVLNEGASSQDTVEVISDNALQLYADDFADSYISSGRFPSVLLFDDILLYGRAVYNALYRMEDLVFEALSSKGCVESRRMVHQKMLGCTDVMVYAMGDTDDVIDTSYLYKMTCVHHRFGSEMIQLSRNISRFLVYYGGANTSHLLSIKIGDPSSLDDSSWHRMDWNYEGRHDVAFLHAGSGSPLSAVHVFRQGVSDDGAIWATGFPCIISVPITTLRGFCSNLTRLIRDTNHSEKLKGVLTSYSSGYIGFKMSLLSLLVSCETLYNFVQSMGLRWDEALISSDLSRICRGFGLTSHVWDVLHELVNDSGRLHDALSLVHEETNFIDADSLAGGLEVPEALTRVLENNLCRVGMDSEREAFEYSHNLRAFRPLSKDCGAIGLKELLDALGDERGYIDRGVIPCGMSLLRYGVNSVRYDITDSTETVDLLLKAGELSTHTFPLRHRYALPALARIEASAQVDGVPPEQLMVRFVQYISEDECAEEFDRPLLEDLRINLPWYAGMTYVSHRNMARWNEVYWGDYDTSSNDALRTSERIRLSGLLLKKAEEFLSQQSRLSISVWS